jgi:hypothetical protein
MRWAARISLVFLLGVAVYTVWPFIDLYRIARTIEAHDAAALSRRVEFRALRASINRQVLATYLRLTGKEASLGPFSDVAIGMAASMVDPFMSDVASAEKLLDVLAKGWPPAASSSENGASPEPGVLIPRTLSAAWTVYASSEYRFNDVYLFVPPTLPLAQRFRLQLRLTQWTWKLQDVQLPAEVRVRLAQELIRAAERR